MPHRDLTLEELIRKRGLTFYSHGRRLKTGSKDFGRYNHDLVDRLLDQSGNKMVFQGPKLEQYLRKPRNMAYLADFAMQLFFKGSEQYADFAILVNVDIQDLNPYYLRRRVPKEEKITNLLGHTLADTSGWLADAPYVEKVWNFAICNAFAMAVGSPGFEYPHTEELFLDQVAWQAKYFLIGTPEQLRRYERYAFSYLKKGLEITRELNRNHGLLFEDPFRVSVSELALHDARLIAENLLHFSQVKCG